MPDARSTAIRNGHAPRQPRSTEWPTLILIVGTYLSIGLVVMFFSTMPLLLGVCLVVLLAFHTSLVHEIIHGHPTPIAWLNDLLGSPPLTLIFPYPVFKQSHLSHHCDAHLTLPGLDPESFFLSARTWHNLSMVERALAWCNMTLLGRLTMNPLISLCRMAQVCCHALLRGPAADRRIWLIHLISSALLLGVIATVTTTPVGVYLLCVYLSHSMISLRSFFEHRAMEVVDHRIVVVDGCRFFNLLYLNNNFHAVHHRYPWLPWYKVESVYRLEGGGVLERNGAFHVAGYSGWLKFLLRPVASPIHPFSD